jgi:hypothetical protein
MAQFLQFLFLLIILLLSNKTHSTFIIIILYAMPCHMFSTRRHSMNPEPAITEQSQTPVLPMPSPITPT